MTLTAEQIVLIFLLVLAVRGLYTWARGAAHGARLPALTLTSEQVRTYQKQAFLELCRRGNTQGPAVDMTDYFADRGWNRADAMAVLAEPVRLGLVKVSGWRFGMYSVTKKGFTEYRQNFMWSGGGDGVNISASQGGFVVANVNSAHAVAHGGIGNRADQHDVSHRQLIDALRTDALGAEPAEAVRAQEYADDLASAVGARDSDRTERVLARINTLLSTASAAFALTRSLLSPGP
ncbi:hypothetical protein ACFYYB_19385 [Streptomyces sp. NPDC002886]|uniref:hypothetical protein n=1 Tax=Streptomyces sp. NPDC002886 TaxID=3364667 RepID=UPI0036BC43AF